uniref:dynein regulatory complex subunit 5 isoform X1 n=1 Tax=Vespula vulgaris TaxID=7454 RepID=UPI00212FFACA|nr:dynein regulatory complex subunit 5 isoform X1 [Vespula vulgaris]
MRIPHTITENILEAYKCSTESSLLPYEQRRTLITEDFNWDDNIVPELKILALGVIVSLWEKYPILEELSNCMDQDVIIETLPTDLPFELTITKITDEHYWERAAKNRWSFNNPNDYGNSWRRLYCERHLAEYLENFEASYFESQREDCMKILELSSEHVRVLKLHSLKPTKIPSRLNDNDDSSHDDVVDHIPMSIILPQLPYLTEMSLNMGMIYMDDGFEWRDFEFSVNDCSSLGEGLKSCYNLKKFSLTRSKLDRARVAALLQKLITNENLEELDFSHCKLFDLGAQAVAEFLSLHKRLKVLRLVNNMIGSEGIAGIVNVLLERKSVVLSHLDLRLNPLGEAGGAHICALLLRNKHLEILNVSSCELNSAIGEVIAQIFKESSDINVETFKIDLSNNNFGPIVGKLFEKIVEVNKYIIGFDARMCNFTKESESSIWQSVLRNKQKRAQRKVSGVQRKSTPSLSLRSDSEYPEIEKTVDDIVSVEDETKMILNSRVEFTEDVSPIEINNMVAINNFIKEEDNNEENKNEVL